MFNYADTQIDKQQGTQPSNIRTKAPNPSTKNNESNSLANHPLGRQRFIRMRAVPTVLHILSHFTFIIYADDCAPAGVLHNSHNSSRDPIWSHRHNIFSHSSHFPVQSRRRQSLSRPSGLYNFSFRLIPIEPPIIWQRVHLYGQQPFDSLVFFIWEFITNYEKNVIKRYYCQWRKVPEPGGGKRRWQWRC